MREQLKGDGEKKELTPKEKREELKRSIEAKKRELQELFNEEERLMKARNEAKAGEGLSELNDRLLLIRENETPKLEKEIKELELKLSVESNEPI